LIVRKRHVSYRAGRSCSAHLCSPRAGKCRATRVADLREDPDIDNDVWRTNDDCGYRPRWTELVCGRWKGKTVGGWTLAADWEFEAYAPHERTVFFTVRARKYLFSTSFSSCPIHLYSLSTHFSRIRLVNRIILLLRELPVRSSPSNLLKHSLDVYKSCPMAGRMSI
jgi:hypothetical protein